VSAATDVVSLSSPARPIKPACAAGRCGVRVDLAPGKRTVAIRGETAIVLFDWDAT
jgi:hypothetical protein